MLTSPLHEAHQQAGAKFSEFGGWLMPLQYAGVLAEHRAVREGVGLFDVSHLGTVRLIGPGVIEHLNTILTNDLGRVSAGQAQYTLVCTEAGGVVDDLIAYRVSDTEVLLVPNAANAQKVIDRVGAGLPAGVELRDEHRDQAVLAIQGPSSDEVLTQLGLPSGHRYMSFRDAELERVALTVCRTGYTGERGYELVVPAGHALEVWTALLTAGAGYGIQPCGLGARDTLRTEMGYPLHGHELTEEITPVEAGAGWAVGWKKPAFVGDAVLRAQKESGPERKLAALRAVGRGIPRPGMTVLAGDVPIGTVTSGTFSPTLGTGIALALLSPPQQPGTRVSVQVRNRSEEFEVVSAPFVPAHVRDE